MYLFLQNILPLGNIAAKIFGKKNEGKSRKHD